MRNRPGRLLVAAAGAALLVSCGSEEVDLGGYAETVCSQMSDFYDAGEGLVAAFGMPLEDPAAFHTQALAALDEFESSLSSARTAISDDPPAVEDGEVITGYFVSYLDAIEDGIAEEVELFRSSDPAAPDYPSAVTALPDTLSQVESGQADPFGEITDQDVIASFQDEPSCVDVVEIS